MKNMENIISSVYHYTGYDILTKIISNKQLRFTSLSFLNDKSEYAYALQLLKNKISDFESKNNIANRFNLNMLDHFSFRKELFSVSFSEDGDCLSFWNSYYVPRNGGISLGFELNELFPQNEFKVNKCIYGDPYPTMSEEQYLWFRRLFSNVLSIHKSIDYIQITFQTAHIKDKRFQIENEWRSVNFAPKNVQVNHFLREGNQIPYFDYPININSLTNIIIGPSTIQERIYQDVNELINAAGLKCQIEKSTIPFNP